MMAGNQRDEFNEISELKMLKFSDLACAAAGCKAAWGLGNILFVSAGSRRPFRDEPTGVNVGNEAFIHLMKWDTDMHSPHTRKLVNEMCSIFVKIQKQMTSLQTSSNKNSLIIKYSREYRSVIKACILELHHTVSCSDHFVNSKCYDQLEMLEMSELLWSLCEILLIDKLPGGLVLRHLLDWWQLRFLEYDSKARDAMSSDSPEDDENYWNAVIYFVLQGRLDDARHLLSLHSQFSTAVFCKMDGLLKSMPLYSKLIGVSSSEFDARWRIWNAECKHLKDQSVFVVDQNLNTISRILAGEVEVFHELSSLLGTWYCMLISKMLYTNPTVQAADLQYYAHGCVEVYGGMSTIKPWDSIMLAAIEIDIHQIIQRCSTEFSSWWLVAHLTDLLHHHCILEPHVHKFGATLREFIILEYALSLISHHSLWQVGFSYLEHCSTFGRCYMAEIIEHISLETEQKAYKVLRICEKNDLQEQARCVCKVMGVQALNNNRLGTALSWGLRSKDATFIAYVAEKYINEYSGSGIFSNLDLIDNLGSSMLLTTKLTFLGKYREFHRLYARAQFDEAAALLLSLLTARIAPKKFWSMLLLDSIPLLETDKVIFSTRQTYELLHCLEELDISQKLDLTDATAEVLSSKYATNEVESEKFAILRLALARNLARAIVHEDSV